MKILLFSTAIILGLTTSIQAQITVTNTQSPANLVQNVLLGSGVVATNITYNTSAPNALLVQPNVSLFSAGTTTFPLSSGILLTTGQGFGAVGPNSSGSETNTGTPMVSFDSDLNAIASATVTNGGILEFDFVPAGDTVSFRYIFGSDEYPEFSPSSFNDAFGFFISGPGFAGPYTGGAENIALIPGTTIPVTINNVGPSSYSTYYLNNLGGASYGTDIEYDGTTVILTSIAAVQCGQTYHIKMAIANVGDQAYDSGVFLEADSFSAPGVDVSLVAASGDTSIIEGCSSALLYFTRPLIQSTDSLIVNFIVSGTATEGVDYNNLIDSVLFLPGEDTVSLILTSILDGSIEGPESITISTDIVTECGDTVTISGTIYIVEPNVSVISTDPFTACPSDSVMAVATGMGGASPYTYSWDYLGQTGDTAYFSIMTMGSVNYVVTATDACGNTGPADTLTVTYNQSIVIDYLIADPSAICPYFTGFVQGGYSGASSAATSFLTGPGSSGTYTSTFDYMFDVPPGVYYYTVTDGACMVTDSVVVDTIPSGSALTVYAYDVSVTCYDPAVYGYVDAFGGGFTYTYTWSYGGSTTYESYLPITFPQTSVDYIISVTDECGNSGTDTLTITFIPTFNLTSSDVTVMCPNDSVPISTLASGGLSPYTYLWSYAGQTGSTAYVPSLINGNSTSYIVNAVDNCGNTDTDTVTVTLNQTLAIDTTLMTPTASCLVNGNVSGTVVGATGVPQYNWEGPGMPGAFNSSTSSMSNIPAGTYYFTVTDNVCSVMDSIVVTQINPPIASFTATPTSGFYPLVVNFTNTSTNATSFDWNFGDGTGVTGVGMSGQSNLYDTEGVYTVYLVAHLGPCTDTAFVDITVIKPNDPATVVLPNVLTPNGDGNNDFFELITTNAVSVELLIVNRWGNKMYVFSGETPYAKWDGNTQNGEPASDGVYFVTYSVVGEDGGMLTGQGYVHLIRN